MALPHKHPPHVSNSAFCAEQASRGVSVPKVSWTAFTTLRLHCGDTFDMRACRAPVTAKAPSARDDDRTDRLGIDGIKPTIETDALAITDVVTTEWMHACDVRGLARLVSTAFVRS